MNRVDELILKLNGVSEENASIIKDFLGEKDVVYSREYATTPDMNCPCCGKFLLTDYPNYCSNCGTLLKYRED